MFLPEPVALRACTSLYLYVSKVSYVTVFSPELVAGPVRWGEIFKGTLCSGKGDRLVDPNNVVLAGQARVGDGGEVRVWNIHW